MSTTHLENILLVDELVSTPACQEAEFGTDEADFSSPPPNDRGRARKSNELVQLDERTLECPLDKDLT